MMSFFASHTGAVVLALLVTFLWSTSWVLIKLGLDELPPLTFAGLRYALGFLCLVPYEIRFRRASPLVPMRFPDWLILMGFGVLFYGITQGAQFMALLHLPAAGLSLLLNLSPLLIAALSFALLTVGLVTESWPGINASQALLIGWLAVVNTALAFLLWNNVLRHLTATEAGVINNAMLPQIAILSWVFLGEAFDLRQILAIVLVMLAVVSLQWLGDR